MKQVASGGVRAKRLDRWFPNQWDQPERTIGTRKEAARQRVLFFGRSVIRRSRKYLSGVYHMWYSRI